MGSGTPRTTGLVWRTVSLILLLVGTARFSQAATTTVFAAISLTDALRQIAAEYNERTSDKVEFNFAASSFLARQIQEGAPADLFFSADEEKMDGLEKQGLIAKGTRRSLLSNSLVIVVAREHGISLSSVQELASDQVKRLALAEPGTVPAGIYAKAYLQKKDLWPLLESKIIPTENVRAALAAVAGGNAEAGIVYKTDASLSARVKVAYQIPSNEAPAISYPVALLKDAPAPEAARRFLQELESDRARKVFEKFGFIVGP